MNRLQVLVTTMHQSDFKKYYEMNLQTDAIIANQADKFFTSEEIINGCKAKLVTTADRGTSKNRNTALNNLFEDDDLIMFSDDDLKFYDGYEEIIINEFKNHPKADAIKFNINCVSDRKISMKPIESFHKASRLEVTSFGVWALVIKKSKINEKKLFFNERFGPGTDNFCGEDSIFLQELFKKRIKLYLSPIYVADIDQSVSTWFKGHNEKQFTVSGMLLNEIYPLICLPLSIRCAYRFSKRDGVNLNFYQILKCYINGIKKNKKEKCELTNE